MAAVGGSPSSSSSSEPILEDEKPSMSSTAEVSICLCAIVMFFCWGSLQFVDAFVDAFVVVMGFLRGGSVGWLGCGCGD